MASVPYSPIPNSQVSGAGLPEVHPNVPEAAFGGGIATAISSLGKTVEGVGSELFERAVWLQNLNNTAEAKAADARYVMEAGQIHANYNSLEGKQAVDEYPNYVKNLQKLRLDIKGTLTTPMAQRQFDSDSLGTLSRTVFNGASKAASAQKSYANGAIDAKISANQNMVMQNPDDEFTYKSGMAESEKLIRQKGGLNGKHPDEINNAVDQRQSAMLATRIQEMAKAKPFEAEKLFEANKDKLWWDDKSKSEDMIRTYRNQTGARQIAAEETSFLYDNSKGKPPEKGLEETVMAGKARAEKMYPDDPDFAYQVEQGIRSRYTRRKQDIKDTEQGNVTTVTAGVIGDFGGKLPTTVDELRTLDPALSKAWDDLPATKRRPFLNALANNAKGDFAPDENNYRKYMGLLGKANSDDAKEREDFASTSIVDLELPQKWRTVLNKKQEAMIHSLGDNPAVSKAMRQLTDAGIVPDPKDKEATAIFRGALQMGLEEFNKENKGRPPKIEELKQLGTQLISPTNDPERYTFFGLRSGKQPLYQLNIPSDFIEKAKADPRLKDAGIELNDEQIRREFLRRRYIELYGGSRKASP